MDTKMIAGPPRARFPLLWKISLLVGGTLALVATVLGAVEGNYFGTVLEAEGRARARAISATLASALVEMPESAIASTIQAVFEDESVSEIFQGENQEAIPPEIRKRGPKKKKKDADHPAAGI